MANRLELGRQIARWLQLVPQATEMSANEAERRLGRVDSGSAKGRAEECLGAIEGLCSGGDLSA